MNRSEAMEFLKKHNITVNDFLKADVKSGYFIVDGSAGDKNILVKLSSVANSINAGALKKEFIISEYLRKIAGNIIRFPEVISMETTEGYILLKRDYIVGHSLGRNDQAYDQIRGRFLAYKSLIIEQIVSQALQFYHKAKSTAHELRSEVDFSNARFSPDLGSNLVESLEKKLGIDLANQIKFYQEISKEFLSLSNICPTFGDLNPANIIIDDNNKVIFSDFGQFCLDNYFMDLTYFWIFLQRHPDWQKELISRIIDTEQDKHFFRASIIRLTSQFGWEKHSDEFIKNNINHKSLKYLKAAAYSFDKIITIN